MESGAAGGEAPPGVCGVTEAGGVGGEGEAVQDGKIPPGRTVLGTMRHTDLSPC